MPEDETITEAPEVESTDLEDQPVETDEQEVATDEVTEVPQETPEAPAPEQVDEIEVEEETPDFGYPEVPTFELPPLQEQIASLPTDEDGNVDAAALLAVIAERETTMQSKMTNVIDAAVAKVEARNNERLHEQKLWEKADAVLPQMKDNPELRSLVQNQRIAAIVEGKNLSPAQAAKNVQKMLGIAKESGARAATESVKVQQSAHLETSSTYAEPSATRQSDLMGKLSSGNRREKDAATQDLIKGWLKDGSITI